MTDHELLEKIESIDNLIQEVVESLLKLSLSSEANRVLNRFQRLLKQRTEIQNMLFQKKQRDRLLSNDIIVN